MNVVEQENASRENPEHVATLCSTSDIENLDDQYKELG